jgi:hypothetical protein
MEGVNYASLKKLRDRFGDIFRARGRPLVFFIHMFEFVQGLS